MSWYFHKLKIYVIINILHGKSTLCSITLCYYSLVAYEYSITLPIDSVVTSMAECSIKFKNNPRVTAKVLKEMELVNISVYKSIICKSQIRIYTWLNCLGKTGSTMYVTNCRKPDSQIHINNRRLLCFKQLSTVEILLHWHNSVLYTSICSVKCISDGHETCLKMLSLWIALQPIHK